MWKTTGRLAFLVLFGGMWSCADQSDALAEKDRVIREQQQDNAALRKEVQDAERTRELVQHMSSQNKQELVQAQRERDGAVQERDRARKLAKVTAVAKVAVPEVRVQDPNIEVIKRSNGEVVLRVGNQVTFAPGSATLTRAGHRTLRKVAQTLKRQKGYLISVEGHTDDTPLKASKKKWTNNMNLSLARAISTRDFLSKVSGIATKSMRVVGYGGQHPLQAGKTKQARSRNRRVEIVLYNPKD